MKARDFGIPFEGRCGKYNAITDVSGVEVGFRTDRKSVGRERVF